MYILKTDEWYLERAVFLIAGIFTLTSALLAWLHSPYWLIFTAFIGTNLIIFATTGFCLMANILYKLGLKPRLQR
ncbi:MAG TPA: DUF2892 domain-containing protein [Dissulfurispiraceae bacterium]|nr:DUF2892 domain-containing protein [Dissulfurispiraceae bacterium]